MSFLLISISLYSTVVTVIAGKVLVTNKMLVIMNFNGINREFIFLSLKAVIIHRHCYLLEN
jgi:hypothetical protein